MSFSVKKKKKEDAKKVYLNLQITYWNINNLQIFTGCLQNFRHMAQ